MHNSLLNGLLSQCVDAFSLCLCLNLQPFVKLWRNALEDKKFNRMSPSIAPSNRPRSAQNPQLGAQLETLANAEARLSLEKTRDNECKKRQNSSARLAY